MARQSLFVPAAVLSCLAGVLSGCHGAHLYNKANHDLAIKAETAFKEAKLGEAVADERALMDEMTERELQVVRRHVSALRNGYLCWLIEKKSADRADALKKIIDKREIELAGSIKTFDEIITAATQLPGRREALRKAKIAFDAPMTPEEAKILKGGVDVATKEIEKIEEILAKAGGLIGKISKEIAEIEAAQETLKTSSQELLKEYATTRAESNAAIMASKEDPLSEAAKKLKETLKEKLEALKKKLEPVIIAQSVLESLGLRDLGLGGRTEQLEGHLSELDALLDVVIAAEGEQDTSNAAVRGQDLQRLHDVLGWSVPLAREVGEALRFPKVSSLLIEAQRLRLELEATKKRLARAEAMVALLGNKRNAVFREMNALRAAEQAVNELETNIDPTDRRKLKARALIAYANSWTLGRFDQEEADFRLIGLRHQGALDSSEEALAQWQNLISVPLAQLSALYGAGITTEEIARLAQAAGVIAIAGGVY